MFQIPKVQVETSTFTSLRYALLKMSNFIKMFRFGHKESQTSEKAFVLRETLYEIILSIFV